jgi:ubiquinone/menaquinone biosynthesis C-methylase UbiE
MRNGYVAFSPELDESEVNIDFTHFKQVAEIEPKHFWYRSRNELILWAIKRYFSGAQNICEIGCGSGYVLSAIEASFPTAKLRGSDASTAGLSFASNRVGSAELFQMDARSVPFAEEFDVIGVFDVLEHIEEDVVVLREMYRATKRGGGIVITVPQHRFLWGPMDEYSCHVRRYGKRELVDKVEQAGFRVERCTSFVSLLLPLMIVSRLLLEGKVNRDGGLPPGLKVHGAVNKLFEKVLSAERAIIRRGGNLAAGGSLMLVARKD